MIIKRTKRNKRKLLLPLLFLVVAMVLTAPFATGSAWAEEQEKDVQSFKTMEDFNRPDVTIACISGSSHGPVLEEMIPNCKISYFNSMADMCMALKSGKVDATCSDETAALYYDAEVGGLKITDVKMETVQYGYALSKTKEGAELREELNEFIEKSKKDGTLEKVKANWITKGGKRQMPFDINELPGPNGTIKYGTDPQMPPFSYIVENSPAGHDSELLGYFCKEKGYKLEQVPMNFDALVPSLASGKVDLIGAGITITKERAESVDFTSPYYDGGAYLCIVDPEDINKPFVAKLKESFTKTFVREDRYKLFIQGVGTTMLILLCAIAIGTVLGFLLFLLCRRGNKIAVKFAEGLTWLIQGMPVVVLLMILYYVVLEDAPVNGTFVSIVAFSLTMATSVYSMIRNGVATVDRGQTEAAYSLGFSDRQTFFRIVLPQAAVHVMPNYKAEIVSLIKATAVVGYIAVQDLTKMGDLIRSRTYDAFFPLIAVAVIYFILSGIMIFFVNKVEFRVDPTNKDLDKVLEGVKRDD